MEDHGKQKFGVVERSIPFITHMRIHFMYFFHADNISEAKFSKLLHTHVPDKFFADGHNLRIRGMTLLAPGCAEIHWPKTEYNIGG
jgi:hypothetical protein